MLNLRLKSPGNCDEDFMFPTIVFWKSGFQISGIPDPDFKSGQKNPFFPVFPEFFGKLSRMKNIPTNL